MTQTIHHQSDGFTLIEVLIAITIFAVGILGVAGMQMTATKGHIAAGNLTHNVMVAQSQEEDLLMTPYHDADLLSAGTHVPDQDADGVDNDSDGTVDEAGETGPITVTYVVDEDTPVLNTKTITMTVTKPHFSGRKTATIIHILPEII
jgi:type IV pilus assembly protein PilV